VQQLLLTLLDDVDPDSLLELEDQARSDRLDDRGGARLFAMHGIIEVDVLLGVDVGDGAATHDDGHGVGEQVAADDEDTGRAWAADELVRGEDHGVLGDRRIPGMHVDVDVGRGRCVVPDRQGAVLVEQLRHGIGVGEDAGDIAGRTEGPDDEWALAMLAQGSLEDLEIDVAVAILGDGDEVRD